MHSASVAAGTTTNSNKKLIATTRTGGKMKTVCSTRPVTMSIRAQNQEAKHEPHYDEDVWNFDRGSDSDSESESDSEAYTSGFSAEPGHRSLAGAMPRNASKGIILPQHLRPHGSNISLAALNRTFQTQGAASAVIEMARRRSQADLIAAAAVSPQHAALALNEQLINKTSLAKPVHLPATDSNQPVNALLAMAQQRSQAELAVLAAISPNSSALSLNEQLTNKGSLDLPVRVPPTDSSQPAAALLEMARRRSSAELAAFAAISPQNSAQSLNEQLGLSLSPASSQHQNLGHAIAAQHAQLSRSAAALAMLDQHIQSRQASAAVVAMAQHQRLQAVASAAMLQVPASAVQSQSSTRKYRRVESDGGFLKSMRRPSKKFKRSESAFLVQGAKGKQSEEKEKEKAQKKKEKKKPEDHLRSLLKAKDLDLDKYSVESATFLPNTKEQTEDYPEAAQAARDGNLEVLESLHKQGKNLQSANIYGESIVHIVCRRGNYALYEFLTQTAKVSIRVRDDLGRTPLHDAAWTDKPNFELVEKILRQEPDLLFARDQRKSSPLAYVPPSRWSVWRKFLDGKPDLIQLAIDSEKTTKAP